MDKDQFYLDEYKALRDEITTALKTRLDFNSWGLLGLGALYSYIFSNLDKPLVFPWLFWVPFGLCLSMVWHLLDQHRMVAKAGRYTREEIEAWIKAGSTANKPEGWETFLNRTADEKQSYIWSWAPVPLWCWLTGATFVIALGFSIAWGANWQPPKATTPAPAHASAAGNAVAPTRDAQL